LLPPYGNVKVTPQTSLSLILMSCTCGKDILEDSLKPLFKGAPRVWEFFCISFASQWPQPRVFPFLWLHKAGTGSVCCTQSLGPDVHSQVIPSLHTIKGFWDQLLFPSLLVWLSWEVHTWALGVLFQGLHRISSQMYSLVITAGCSLIVGWADSPEIRVIRHNF
jgi:hypothetical protein